jgi:hypothetical protein
MRSSYFGPASSTTKAGRHDIAEILLKVALNTINQINQSFLCLNTKIICTSEEMYRKYNSKSTIDKLEKRFILMIIFKFFRRLLTS